MKKKDIIDAEIVEKEEVENEEEVVEVDSSEISEVVEEEGQGQDPTGLMDLSVPLPEGIRKTFTIDEATYVEYANFVNKKRSIKTTLIMAVIIALVVSFFFKTDNWLDTLKYMVIYAGLYLLIALGSSRVLSPYLMKTTYRKRGIGSIQFDVLISDEGMIQSFEEGRLKLGWNDFLAVQESNNSIFFTLVNKRAILVPKSIYSNEELVTIRNLLNRNLDELVNQLQKFENE